MGEVLTVRATGANDVEAVWRQFVPGARLDHVDPDRVRFDWSSIDSGTFSLVQYSLRADVRSSVQLDDQIMACQLAALDARLRAEDRDIDPRQPWLTGDGPMRARWSGTGKVRAFLFDRTSAERVARAVSGDDRLVLRTIDSVARDRMLASQWERSFGYVASALVAGHEHPLVAAELERHALLSTLSVFSTTYRGSRRSRDPAGRRTAHGAPGPRLHRFARASTDHHRRRRDGRGDLHARPSARLPPSLGHDAVHSPANGAPDRGSSRPRERHRQRRRCRPPVGLFQSVTIREVLPRHVRPEPEPDGTNVLTLFAFGAVVTHGVCEVAPASEREAQ